MERQHKEEVARLKKAMGALVSETGERVRREVEVVRDECNKRMEAMAEEIARLEEVRWAWQVGGWEGCTDNPLLVFHL